LPGCWLTGIVCPGSSMMDGGEQLSTSDCQDDVVDVERHWESLDYCLAKYVLTEGSTEEDCPRLGATGTINVSEYETINFKHEQSEIISNKTFHIGFATTEFDRSLERILCLMHPQEIASVKVRIPSASPDEEPDTLFDCRLLQVDTLQNVDPVYKWPPELKHQTAQQMYAKGVDLCKSQRYSDAFPLFRQALNLLSFVQEGENYDRHAAASAMEGQTPRLPPTSGLLKDKCDLEAVKSTRTKCLNNLSLCQMKLGDYQSVVAISSNSDDVKSLYRLGLAQGELGNYQLAVQALEKALTQEPSNKAVASKLQEIKEKRRIEKRDNEKLAQGLKKMFA